jgi:hypothetical protein
MPFKINKCQQTFTQTKSTDPVDTHTIRKLGPSSGSRINAIQRLLER